MAPQTSFHTILIPPTHISPSHPNYHLLLPSLPSPYPTLTSEPGWVSPSMWLSGGFSLWEFGAPREIQGLSSNPPKPWRVGSTQLPPDPDFSPWILTRQGWRRDSGGPISRLFPVGHQRDGILLPIKKSGSGLGPPTPIIPPTRLPRQRKKHVEAVRQLDGGEEADVAGVTLREPHQGGGRLGRDGEGQHHAGTGPNPQQVLTGQQGRDPQTGCLVLPDNGIRAWGGSRPSASPSARHGAPSPTSATAPVPSSVCGVWDRGRDPNRCSCCEAPWGAVGLGCLIVGLYRYPGAALLPRGIAKMPRGCSVPAWD